MQSQHYDEPHLIQGLTYCHLSIFMRRASWRSIYHRRSSIRRFQCHTIWKPPLTKSNSQFSPDPISFQNFTTINTSITRGQKTVHSFQNSEKHADLEGILKRAPHGIDSLQRLDEEADVGHLRDQGHKLTDLPVNRQDLDLWLVLLEYRFLKDQEDGVYDVLFGMRNRGPAVKLLDYDTASENIWQLSLAGALHNESILSLLCDPLTSIGRERPTLFFDIVGELLKVKNIRHASDSVLRLRASHFRGSEDAYLLAELLMDRTAALSIDEFIHIHQRLPFVAIYHDIVPALWKSGNPADAFKMHKYLLEHADGPKNFEQVVPFIRHLAENSKSTASFTTDLEKHGIGFESQIRKFYSQVKAHNSGLSVEAMNVMMTNDTGIRQRKLKDHFVAKVIATHALSFEFAIKTVKFFGLVEVGPLAVREMATSAPNHHELLKRFQLLKELEIDTGSSMFVAIVRRLCEQGATSLLKGILECDQHHDVFDDQEIQKRLLAGYYARNDWIQVNRTLVILNRGELGPESRWRAQSLLFESAIMNDNSRKTVIKLMNMVARTKEKARNTGRSLNSTTVDCVISLSLSEGNAARSHDERSRCLQHTVALVQNMKLAGMTVEALHWQQILYELAHMGDIEQFETLIWWIAYHYGSSETTSTRSTLHTHGVGATETLETIYSLDLQAKFIRCCIYLRPMTELQYLNMSRSRRGPDLLRSLEDKFRFRVDRTHIRNEYLRQGKRVLPSLESIQRDGEVFDAVWNGNLRSHIVKQQSENVMREMLPGQNSSDPPHFRRSEIARLS